MSYFTLIHTNPRFLTLNQDRDSNQVQESYIQTIEICSGDEDWQNSWVVQMKLCSKNESK